MRGAGGFTQDLDGVSSGTSGSESGTPSPSEADREKQQRDGGQARRGVPSPRPRSPPEGTLASQAGFVIAGQRKDPAHSPTQGLGGLARAGGGASLWAEREAAASSRRGAWKPFEQVAVSGGNGVSGSC